MKTLMLVLFLLLPLISYGQEVSIGNPEIVDEIKKKTSWIYDNKDKTHFLLTEQKLLNESISGTNVIAYIKDNSPNRIVTSSFTKKGQLSTEWYFENEKVIFVYQVFEYFNEYQNEGSWKNFKGLSGWESRYYFAAEELKYHKHIGRSIDKTDSHEDIITLSATKVLTYVNDHIK